MRRRGAGDAPVRSGVMEDPVGVVERLAYLDAVIEQILARGVDVGDDKL